MYALLIFIKKKMTKFLKFLQGKKTLIASLVMATVPLLLSKGYVDQEVATYILAVSAILFWGASIATGALLSKKQ